MARLIDADKLKKELEVNGLGYQYYMLDNAPTVKAIPVEWIRKYTNHRTVEFGDMWVFINCMINDWEKENADSETE